MLRLRFLTFLSLPLLLAAACDGARGAGIPAKFEVLATYPHDSLAYTQGLLLHEGKVLESTGNYGRSELRRVEIASGRVEQAVSLPANRFGEGLVLFGDRLYQLTWESQVGYVYDVKSFAVVDSFTYKGEGWGLATDGKSIIMSDGSDSLRFLTPGTMATERVIRVKHKGSPLTRLNELEWVDGRILANVYESDWVAQIDPATGDVIELYDFASLWPRETRKVGTDVFNGISLGPDPGTLLVTGKYWPAMYLVRLRATPGA